MKFRVGDEVIITAGKDKGKRGKIEKVFPKENKVLVPNVNIYKKFRKKKQNQNSGIIEFSRPLPVANIAIICPHCNERTRIGYKIVNEQKMRFCKKCKKEL